MADLESLVEQATRSELFTAPRLEGDLERFLGEQAGRLRDLAARVAGGEFDHVFLVGSGNSWANMSYGKYLLDRFSTVTADDLTAYEFIWRNPARLGPRSLVFLASYSGATEDTLAALRHANAAGACTIALVRRRPSPMAAEARETIDYDSTALYVLPLAAVTLFACEVGRLQGGPRAAEAQAVADGLAALPPFIGKAYRDAKEPALREAREFLSADLLYCIGAGPLYNLAYKFGLTVFMENMRVHGSVIESSELRHGPCEMFERQKADMVFLLGTDASRPMTERAIALARQAGAHVLVYDAAEYHGVHPLLTPFVLIVPLQWFVVYGSLLRGITDLDERVFMGHRVLATGPDATWP